MLKFRKQHFLDKIYYFVIFAFDFLEDFDVLILLSHLSMKGYHHMTGILHGHLLVRGAINIQAKM